MKIILQTLFFLMLVPQICFGQWVQVGLNNEVIKDITVQNQNIFAVTSDNGKLYRSIDNGANWNMIVDSNAVDVVISGTGKIFMVWDSLRTSDPFAISPVCLLSSIDNANTWIWSDIMEQLSDSIWRGNPQTITVSPEGIVFCGVWADRPDRFQLDIIAISNDDGLVWTTPGMGVLGGKLFDFRNQFVITYGIISGVGAGGHEIHLSSDYGNSWTYLGWPSYENSPYLALGFFPNGNIIIGGNEYLLLSSDMCSTWTEIATLNSQVGLSYSIGSTEGMIIGTKELGVFLFSDEGDSLGSRNDGLTNLNIHTLTLDNNGYVYAGTENGVWRRPLSEIATSIGQEPTQPTEFILSQSYPNPFNSSCAIRYSIPQLSQVSLKVFNTLGEEIQTLVNEEKPVGTYELNWYASNLSSGVYFYKLQSGQYTSVKKMILMK